MKLPGIGGKGKKDKKFKADWKKIIIDSGKECFCCNTKFSITKRPVCLLIPLLSHSSPYLSLSTPLFHVLTYENSTNVKNAQQKFAAHATTHHCSQLFWDGSALDVFV